MAIPFLETIGLTQKEAEIYELLVKNGEMPVSQVIRELKIKRATAYKSLYSLEGKRLITKQDKGKILHVKPESPNKLLDLSDTVLKKQERARSDLQSALPDLVSSFILAVEKPVVSIHEGVNGLKDIYEDTLREKQTIYAALLPGEIDEELRKYLRTSYLRKRTKAGIYAYVLAASNSFSPTYAHEDTEYNRTTLVVPGKKFPFQHEINIYGTKVAFIDYKRGDALIGIIINHPQIAKTMKALYDLAWEGAEHLYMKKK